MKHTHEISHEHGKFQPFVMGCPACDAMKAERDEQAAAYRAAMARGAA